MGIVFITNYLGKFRAFFDHLPPSIDIFYPIDVDGRSTFLDYLPPSSCKRSLWTTPYAKTSQEQCVSNSSNTKNYFGILNISRMSEAQIILSLTNIFISLGTHEYFFCCLLCKYAHWPWVYFFSPSLSYVYLNQSWLIW